MKRYVTVVSDEIVDLEEQVEKLLNMGYDLHGNLQIVHLANGTNRFRYFQVLTCNVETP